MEGLRPCLNGEASLRSSTNSSDEGTVTALHETFVFPYEGLSVPVFAVDRTGSVILWNRCLTNASGIQINSTATSNGKSRQSLTQLLAKHSGAEWNRAFQKALSGSSAKCVIEIQCTSGAKRFLVNVAAHAAPGAGGQVDAVVCFLEESVDPQLPPERAAEITKSTGEWEQIIQTANCPIFGLDISGRVNVWNKCMVETTGFSTNEAFRTNFVETFVESERREAMKEIIRNALTGNKTENIDIDIHSRLGDVLSLFVSTSPRRNLQDEIVGVMCFAQDTTESSKHDRAIATMASELRQLIDTANTPIFGIDSDGLVNEWNEKTAEILGYSREEAFDRPLIETFILPDMQASAHDIMESARQGRGTSNYELEFCTKSSEIRHLLVNVTTRRDARNNVVGVVIVAQDVTESVQRDRAVAGMALELRQLIDTANAPIFGIDIDGNINEWNRRTQEITGYSKEETFDEPLVERFIAPSTRRKVQEILDAALQGNETSNYELEFISKSGEPRFMLVNATTRRDPEFNVVGVVGVGQDVTEDRKYAEEIRKMHYIQATQEVKVETERNMTAYFAHELRNPLSAIDSALNSMPEDLPETAKSLIAGMQLCTSFMSSVMNNLLDVRKMEEGMLTLTKSPLSLSNILSNVHKMLLPSVKPGVDFTAQSDTNGRDWVYGDEHRLQQVMTNVVTNAIKYTLKGNIKLSIGWSGDLVKFECADSGPGIPKTDQKKLFQRFVQRGGAPGTGLGLAIAKNIVKLAGGNIRFESDPSIKPGTTCIVEVPLPPCESRETTKPDVKSEQALLEEELTFLIIDDVKMNRMMLSKRIQKGIAPNALISEASTGEEALAICGNEKFDVIVVDQFMEEAGGVMVGTDVVYAMRRMRIDSIIIGCSGNDLSEEFTEAGADWVWQKPMPSNAEIIAHLRRAMKKNRVLARDDRASPSEDSSSV